MPIRRFGDGALLAAMPCSAIAAPPMMRFHDLRRRFTSRAQGLRAGLVYEAHCFQISTSRFIP